MLFLHVLAALWLAGGVFAGTVVRAQGRKATRPEERLVVLRIAWLAWRTKKPETGTQSFGRCGFAGHAQRR